MKRVTTTIKIGPESQNKLLTEQMEESKKKPMGKMLMYGKMWKVKKTEQGKCTRKPNKCRSSYRHK